MPPSRPSSLLEVGALAGLVAAMGCVTNEKVPTIPTVTAASIAIVSGSGQSGVITLGLAQPLIVRVTDAGGQAVSGYQVLWTVSAGGGTVPATTRTGTDGTSSAQWVLGAQLGAVTATAGNAALTGATKEVTFSATALGASIVLESGDLQSAFAGDELTDDFVVRLADANGNPVFGKTVVWSVTSGGGSLSPANAISRADGLASSRYTLGATAGFQTIEATASAFTGSPISFRASAQQRPLGATVSVRDNFFTPSPATVAAGSRVVWNWEGFNFHNVTFINAPAANSDSPTQQSGLHEVVFLNTGVFSYFCTIHGTNMSGTVVVN